MDKITAILRKEKNPYTGKFEPIVFFPEFSAMFGKIVCYDGCHNEADINYYAKTKPATPSEYPDFWKKFMQVYDDVEIILHKRMNYKTLSENWCR